MSIFFCLSAWRSSTGPEPPKKCRASRNSARCGPLTVGDLTLMLRRALAFVYPGSASRVKSNINFISDPQQPLRLSDNRSPPERAPLLRWSSESWFSSRAVPSRMTPLSNSVALGRKYGVLFEFKPRVIVKTRCPSDPLHCSPSASRPFLRKLSQR
jgi:hypothetical protein